MPFKVVVSDPGSGRSYQVEVKDPEARRLLGLRIGDKFDGSVAGLPGYELQITGGTDRDGFPMRPDVSGSGRASILLAGGPGFKPRKRGGRRRKRVRGSRISEAIIQVNTKIVKHGKKSIQEIFQPEEAKIKPPEKPPEKLRLKILEVPEAKPEKPEEVPAPKRGKAEIKESVLRYIIEHGGEIDIAECAKELALSTAEVEEAIESLQKEGQIEEEEVGPPPEEKPAEEEPEKPLEEKPAEAPPEKPPEEKPAEEEPEKPPEEGMEKPPAEAETKEKPEPEEKPQKPETSEEKSPEKEPEGKPGEKGN